VVDRFDLQNGGYLGFEDFCVLNGLRTDQKYSGGYETRLFKRLREFIDPADYPVAAEKLYRLFVLNCAIRNGDAHLKNFGLLYRDVNGPAHLAPVYDLVCTTAYIAADNMALTLNGSTNWPDRRRLIELGQTRADLSLQKIEAILQETADAIATVAPQIRKYSRSSEYEVAIRIYEAWQHGLKETLGISDFKSARVSRTKKQPRIARSDRRILEHLRRKDGIVTGTQKTIAAAIGIPESTLNAAVKRLADRGLVAKELGRLRLV
jgi:serine/threonine-protein kinase HipA